MTTTYCVDTDITKHDPFSAAMLPASDSGSFDRLRVLAKAEIDRRILRREPPVDADNLADTTELTECEVRFVLHFLYRDAASRTGDGALLWEKSEYWSKLAEAEIDEVPLSVSEDDGSEDSVPSMGAGTPIWRS